MGSHMFKIHHIAISVSDLNKSIEFYGIFGFKKLAQWDAPDGSMKVVHLKLGDCMLELFNFKNHHPAPISSLAIETDLPTLGVKHFGLQVKSIEEIKNFLQKNGISGDVTIKKGHLVAEYFFVKDPDGILIEIVQDDRTFTVK